MNFNQLASATTGELFDTFISEDKQLMIQRTRLVNNLYELLPNTNDSEVLNKFYKLFISRPTGTIEYCKDMAKAYYQPWMPYEKYIAQNSIT